jgi:hypothetical protein
MAERSSPDLGTPANTRSIRIPSSGVASEAPFHLMRSQTEAVLFIFSERPAQKGLGLWRERQFRSTNLLRQLKVHINLGQNLCGLIVEHCRLIAPLSHSLKCRGREFGIIATDHTQRDEVFPPCR